MSCILNLVVSRKGDNLVIYCLFFGWQNPSKLGSITKRKNWSLGAEFCSPRDKFFPLRADPNGKEIDKENNRVVSP